MKIITATGSLDQVGFEIGRATAEDVRSMLSSVASDLCERLFGGDRDDMLQAAKRLLALAPERAAEAARPFLKGMARGAAVDEGDLLALSLCEELSVVPARDRDRCSTLAVWTDQGWLIGHQEDYVPEFYGRMRVYDLRIDGFPRTVSLNYPGHLPHLAGSLNEAGLALVNNALWPEVAGGHAPKQPSHFLAAMSSGTDAVLDASMILRLREASLTDHFLIADEKTALSLEVSNRKRADGYYDQRSVAPAATDEPSRPVAPFVHTNSVRWLDLKEPDPSPHGSHMRFHRLSGAAVVAPPSTPAEMLALFMAKDGVINRDASTNWTSQPNSVTLATIVIRPRTREIWFVGYPEHEILRVAL